MFAVGDCVIQIPPDWPSRKGTVTACDDILARILIAWDDGRSEWVNEEDFEATHLWLIGSRTWKTGG